MNTTVELTDEQKAHADGVAQYLLAYASNEQINALAEYGLMISVGVPEETTRIAAALRARSIMLRVGRPVYMRSILPFHYNIELCQAFDNAVALYCHQVRTGAQPRKAVADE